MAHSTWQSDDIRRAMIALQRNQRAQATAICNALLAEQPDDAVALGVLGMTKLASGAAHAALDALQQAVMHRPNDPELRMQLGRAHVAADQPTDAIRQFERAQKLDRRYVIARAEIASIHERQGKHERALRVLEPAIHSGQYPLPVASVYLRALMGHGKHDRAAAFGRAVSVNSSRSPIEISEFLLTLARALEGAGAYGDAIAAAERGNAMYRATFRPDGIRNRFTKLRSVFNASFVDDAPQADAVDQPVIFIVGMPRTGSTLIERILDRHRHAVGIGESTALPQVVVELPELAGLSPDYPDCVPELDRDAMAVAQARYLDQVQQQTADADDAVIVDKMLTNFMQVGLLHQLMPGARVIWARRDPLDCCLSCYFERLSPTVYPYAADLRHLGFYHRAHESLMEHWKQVTNVPILEVQYEMLVSEPEAQIRRLLEFCGLTWDDACLQFHQGNRTERTLSYDQVTRPLYRRSIRRAAPFEPWLAPLRDALANPDAVTA